jgi:hypothetical protein
VFILQYADDTIILFKYDFDMTVNVKLLLYLHENMVRLKINFDKSEVLLTMEYTIKLERSAEIFNCQMGFGQLNILVLL